MYCDDSSWVCRDFANSAADQCNLIAQSKLRLW